MMTCRVVVVAPLSGASEAAEEGCMGKVTLSSNTQLTSAPTLFPSLLGSLSLVLYLCI